MRPDSVFYVVSGVLLILVVSALVELHTQWLVRRCTRLGHVWNTRTSGTRCARCGQELSDA